MCLTPNARHIGTINVWFFSDHHNKCKSFDNLLLFQSDDYSDDIKKNICIYGLKLRQIWNLDTNNKKKQQQTKKHHKLKNINSFRSFKDKMFSCFGVYISTLYGWSFMNDNWTKKITNQNNIRLQIYRMPQNICEVCLSGLYHGNVNM